MRSSLAVIAAAVGFTLASHSALAADRLLVEAESFDNPGGWVLDTQFIEIMGSPYLLAHGLGNPVADATTAVTFPKPGTYHVFVRTKDWVAPWKAPGAPGKFKLAVNGKELAETFGTKSAEWFWHPGGTVEIKDTKATLTLHDLTGFAGRADAIYFTTDASDVPPANGEVLPQWRRELLGLPAEPQDAGPFDLVVIGGGYGGMGAAISAARNGLKVALIQNRPVLGGNGSSEVRVWAMGGTRRGKYPMLGEIVEEFSDRAKKSPGTHEEFGDDKKEALVRAEPNIALYLNHHAYQVQMDGKRIASVTAFDTRDSSRKRFVGKLFVDATGHATIATLAGADVAMQQEGHLGMSNMWRWEETDSPQSFPNIEWALDLNMDDFPYPRDFHGQWFWESGFDKHPIDGLESMRDWNLRAVYGAFNAMKNRDGAAKHPNARLTWIAYIGGPRESRQILGDVILTREDIVGNKPFPDGTAPTTWDIDLHYPKKQYMNKYPQDPFISVAVFDKHVDRNIGYPVPYRCFYSRNIENLFSAGRDISVTHEALGTVRVMRTGGMIGEVVGKAAGLCVKHNCTPRQVYESHWSELDQLMQMPGVMRRDTVDGEWYKRDDAVQLAPVGIEFIDPAKLPGVVVDDNKAVFTGDWGSGEGLKNYVGDHYRYVSGGSGATATYRFTVPKTGRYEVRVSHQPHENRATTTPVTIHHAGGSTVVRLDQKAPPKLEKGFSSVGVFEFEQGKPASVVITASEDAGGTVHADAVQLLPVQ